MRYAFVSGYQNGLTVVRIPEVSVACEKLKLISVPEQCQFKLIQILIKILC